MPSPRERVTVALDTPDLDRALEWAAAVRDHVGGLKLGLEFLTANGPAGVARVAAIGLPLFLDVKFHDIPNTVAGAVGAACRLGAAIVNVHAAGGAAMLAAAVAAARETTSGRPKIIAVTVLTSLDEEDLRATGQQGPVAEQVLRLAALAQACGLDGVVCSPHEISDLRRRFGPDFLLVVPGIRPAWAAAGDQKRVMTPAEALAAGADILVLGRAITRAADPAATAQRLVAELADTP